MSTTATRQAESKDIIYALNKCIETCTDGEKGYAAVAADVRDPALKILFQQKSLERATFVLDLQRAIQKLGAIAENQGTAKGTAHRGFMGVRMALEGRSDRVLLEECARGEQAAFKAHQHAFKRAPLDTLPHEIRTLVQIQYATLQADVEAARRRLVSH